jgi:hypothetical protein
MAEDRELPGWPKKRLVKDVRSHLRCYGIRPRFDIWRATWSWASAIANSYYYINWPMPSEIATQYLLLLLTRIKENHGLKLPHRANTVIPDSIRHMLPTSPMPMIEDRKTKRKKAPASRLSKSSPPPPNNGEETC